VHDWWTQIDNDILGCLADGALTPAQIGVRLGISEGATTSLLSMLAREGKVRICLVELLADQGARAASPSNDRGEVDMEERQPRRRAAELWKKAYGCQMEGELDRAIDLYHRSIEVYPTAEAHTFLGWTMGVQGRFEEATRECRHAIDIDPEFGNPYNDIGVYLMQRDKLDEAIPWFEQAKKAVRYEPRQFPFMNLGRIYLQQGRWWEALREFEGAARLAPDDARAAKMLHRLRGRLN
jgi:tetratricopeptide (TPR) repeat protein